MTSIAIITTCKGRLHHLREALPRFVAQAPMPVPMQVIVVDYGCPDHAGDWAEAEFPGVQVVRVADDPGFCLGRARNIGARQAKAEWLAFLDADTLLADNWHAWMQAHLRPGHFYRRGLVAGIRDAETHGAVVCPRAQFEAIEGYDELYRGWGGEDEDLYQRLAWLGTSEGEYPAELLWAISHGDDERAGWEGLRTRQDMIDLCASYRLAKMETLRLLALKGELPIELRRQFMESTRTNLAHWFDSGRKADLAMHYELRAGEKLYRFTINLAADGAAA